MYELEILYHFEFHLPVVENKRYCASAERERECTAARGLVNCNK